MHYFAVNKATHALDHGFGQQVFVGDFFQRFSGERRLIFPVMQFGIQSAPAPADIV